MASRERQVCSATLSWLVPGVIVTATLCAEAASTSIRSYPTPVRAITRRFRGERKQVGRHPLSAGDQGVDLAQKRKKLLSRQREVALRIDHLESGIRKDLAKAAGLVSKQIGADQDSGHGHLGVNKV